MSNPQNKPTSCSQGAIDITGCRFSLYPMSDRFVEIILNSIQRLQLEHVWHQTDHLSSVFRGRPEHVIDCARAAFIYAAANHKNHLVGEFTFSRGCPGDCDADRYLSADPTPQNLAAIPLGDGMKTAAKISFYAFATDDYMMHIQKVVQLAETAGLHPQKAHYVTLIEGDASALFCYFAQLLAYAHQHLNHYVLQVTLSVNSPSIKE